MTIHVAGAIPSEAAERIRRKSASIQQLPEDQQPERRREIFIETENWLDRIDQNPHFRDPNVASMICDSVEHLHRSDGWRMIEYVVMPNHVHLLFQTDRRLKSVISSFKQWVARHTPLPFGMKRVWQRKWFDHWSRSMEQDARFRRYIRRNPVTAGLADRPEDWQFGSAGRPLPQ